MKNKPKTKSKKLLCPKAGTATSSPMKKYHHLNLNVLFG
jgi:hypothetical protein